MDNYEKTIDNIQERAVYTAAALSDGLSRFIIAMVGLIASFPEATGLWLSTENIPAIARLSITVALPLISIGAVYLAVMQKSRSMWTVFLFQLSGSLAITIILDGMGYNSILVLMTGFGGLVAAAGAAFMDAQKTDRMQWRIEIEQAALDADAKREQAALDAEAKRELKRIAAESKAAERSSGVQAVASKRERIEQAQKLKSDGLSQRKIAEVMGLSVGAVNGYLNGK